MSISYGCKAVKLCWLPTLQDDCSRYRSASSLDGRSIATIGRAKPVSCFEATPSEGAGRTSEMQIIWLDHVSLLQADRAS